MTKLAFYSDSEGGSRKTWDQTFGLKVRMFDALPNEGWHFRPPIHHHSLPASMFCLRVRKFDAFPDEGYTF